MILSLIWLLVGSASSAAEVYEKLTIRDKVYTNVRVVQSNPAEVIMSFDGGGAAIKRQDLPAELRDKYPYDAEKAAEFEKERAAKLKAQREQQRADMFAALIRQERDLRFRIDQAEADTISLQKEIKAWRAKPRVPGKAVALDQLIDKKMNQTRYIEDLRRQLDDVHQRQEQFR